MQESRLDLSKITFEDVLDGVPATGKKAPDVVIPPKDQTPDPEPDPEPEPTPEPEPDSSNFYTEINRILGYEVEGEFDESVEGVANYTKAVAEQIAQAEIKDLFENFPDVKEYLQFRLNDGSPEKYFEAKYADADYTKYNNFTENDEATQEIVVRKYLSNQGWSEEEITETVKEYRDSGLLYKNAKRAADKLVTMQHSKKESLLASQAEQAKLAERQREETIAQISGALDKGSLKNIMIPEKDRKEFKQWLLQPDAKGVTKRQQAMAQLSLEEKLELEYMVYKGFDVKDLIKKEATKTRIDFLKNAASSKNSRLGGTGKEAKFPKGNKLEGLKLENIL